MRTRAKRDGNEPIIRQALEAAGCRCWPINDRMIPDLLVELPSGELWLVEVKARHGTLTPRQQKFWTAPPERSIIARTAEAALAALGLAEGVSA